MDEQVMAKPNWQDWHVDRHFLHVIADVERTEDL